MAYATGNPKTKAELKRWIANGQTVRVFSPGPYEPSENGIEYVEGPHYPRPHRWYAAVTVKDGVIVCVK